MWGTAEKFSRDLLGRKAWKADVLPYADDLNPDAINVKSILEFYIKSF